MNTGRQQQSKNYLFRKASRQERIIAVYIFLIFGGICAFLFLAAFDKIDIGRVIPPCGMKVRYNLPCPTCGVTTSMLAFFRGQIIDSFYIQPTGGVLGCTLILTVFFAFPTAVFGVYFSFLDRLFLRLRLRYIIIAAVAVFILGWIITLIRTFSERT